MWKRLAVLVVVALLPVSAVAHTRLFYRMSCRSDYRKVEVITPMPESAVTAEPIEVQTADPTAEPTEEPTAIPPCGNPTGINCDSGADSHAGTY